MADPATPAARLVIPEELAFPAVPDRLIDELLEAMTAPLPDEPPPSCIKSGEGPEAR